MKKIFNTIILGFICLPLLAQAGYYRWTDDNGKIHYSYTVPPSEAQLGHVQLSKNGIKKKTVLSAKKTRERKLLEIKAAKQKKIDDEKKKRDRIVEAEDSRLLYIFNNEEEVTESYNAKLRLAQLTIDLLKARHKVQSKKLEKLEERQERAVSLLQKQSLSKQVSLILDNLKVYQQAITENIIEKDKVRKDYNKTLQRYMRLTSAKADKDEIEILKKEMKSLK